MARRHCPADGGKFAALTAFHLRVGVRIALKSLAPVLALVFGMYYLLKPEFFAFLAGIVFRDSGPFAVGAVSAAVFFAAAAVASPRVSYGLAGWVRHLPIDEAVQRRLAVLALIIAQAPVLVVMGIFALLGARLSNVPLFLLLPGYLLAAAAAAESLIPRRTKGLRLVAGPAACVCSATGRWPLLIIGAALVLLLDLGGGRFFRSRRRLSLSGLVRATGLPLGIGLRAVGWRWLVSFAFAAAVHLMTRFFLVNNDLTLPLAAAGVRLGGILALSAFISSSAAAMTAARPPWPWARSLPRSSRNRVQDDALLLGGLGSIATIPAFFLGFPAAVFVIASLPFLAARAVVLTRSENEFRFSIWGKSLLEGFLVAIGAALFAPAAILVSAFAVPALRDAARRERTMKVSRWDKLRQIAAGDPLSWSER
jgi:hypothetical protein